MRRAGLLACVAIGAGSCHDFNRAYEGCVDAGVCEGAPIVIDRRVGLLVVEPPALTLRTVFTEPVSAPFTVHNIGLGPAKGVSVGDPLDSAHFIESNNCTADLAPDASCSGTVAFQYDGGEPYDSLLHVTSDQSGGVDLPLHGRVVLPLTVSPDSIDFGLVFVHDVSAPRTVTVTNNSTVSATAPLEASVPLLLNMFPFIIGPQFGFDAGTCVGALPPLGSCAMGVVAAPSLSSAGGTSQTLTIVGRDDGGARPPELGNVALSMTTFRRAELVFPVTDVLMTDDAGQVDLRPIELDNYSNDEATGVIAVSWTDDAGVFAFDAGACAGVSLDAGSPPSRCTMTFAFHAPARGGAFQATLAATATPGGTALAHFTGHSVDLVPLVVTVIDAGTVMSDAGINCPGTCSRTVRRFSNVTLVATPKPNFVLDAWELDCADAGGAACTVSPTTDAGAVVRARFRLGP